MTFHVDFLLREGTSERTLLQMPEGMADPYSLPAPGETAWVYGKPYTVVRRDWVLSPSEWRCRIEVTKGESP
jgi:hypothetical protein